MTDHETKTNRAMHSFAIWSEAHNDAEPWAHVASQLGADERIIVEGSADFRVVEFEDRPESTIGTRAPALDLLRSRLAAVDKPTAMALDAPSVCRMREMVRKVGELGTRWTQYETVAVVRAETYGEPHRLMIVSLESEEA